MRRRPLPIAGHAVIAAAAGVALGAGAAGCAGEDEGPSVLVSVEAESASLRPDHLLVTWWSGATPVVENRRVPERGAIGASSGSVATVLFYLGADRQDRRILVAGMRGGARIATGAARVPWAPEKRRPVTVTLKAELADSDGDGVPDAIDDDCPAPLCRAAAADAGAGADGASDAGAPGPGGPDAAGGVLDGPPAGRDGPAAAGDGSAASADAAIATVDAPAALDGGAGADVRDAAAAPDRAGDDAAGGAGVDAARDAPLAPPDARPDVNPDAIDLLRGLVGAWTMDEGQGTGVMDRSGSANHGQIRNPTPTPWVMGYRGGALSFGAQMNVNVPTSASLDTISTQISITAWIWRDTTPVVGEQTILSRQKTTTQINAFWFGFRGPDLRFGLEDVSIEADMGLAPPAGRWVHVAAIFDGQQMRLYQEGVLIDYGNPGPRSLSSSYRPVLIGGDANTASSEATSNFFVGRIDEVALYNRALSPAELTTLATLPPM